MNRNKIWLELASEPTNLFISIFANMHLHGMVFHWHCSTSNSLQIVVLLYLNAMYCKYAFHNVQLICISEQRAHSNWKKNRRRRKREKNEASSEQKRPLHRIYAKERGRSRLSKMYSMLLIFIGFLHSLTIRNSFYGGFVLCNARNLCVENGVFFSCFSSYDRNKKNQKNCRKIHEIFSQKRSIDLLWVNEKS